MNNFVVVFVQDLFFECRDQSMQVYRSLLKINTFRRCGLEVLFTSVIEVYKHLFLSAF